MKKKSRMTNKMVTITYDLVMISCFSHKFFVILVACFFAEIAYAQHLEANRRENSPYVTLFFPLNGNDLIKVSSVYGYRKHPIDKKGRWHMGIDLAATKGKPVYAAAEGVVQKAVYEKGYGNNVVIAHPGGMKTLYGHLWFRTVRPLQKVCKGQLIGFVGDTGKVTGPHLHYEIWFKNKRVDPALVWKSDLVQTLVK